MLYRIVWILMTMMILGACAISDDADGEGGRGLLDDPLAPYAWHLKNTGQNSFARYGGVAGMDPKIYRAHEKGYSGEGIRIAVSDSGVEATHEDLRDNMLLGELRNYDLDAVDDGDPSTSPWLGNPGDYHGHGTGVSGLIGAVGGNLRGSYGVAYNARLSGFFYIGIDLTTSSKEIDQASGNFDIFNYSYGSKSCTYHNPREYYIDQLKYGTTVQRGGKGSIYVKAGGNSWLSGLNDCDDSFNVDRKNIFHFYFGNATMEWRHNWPYIIAVGAYSADGKKTSYSTPGSALWISAPGGEYGRDGRGEIIVRSSSSYDPAMVTTDLEGCDRGKSRLSSDPSLNGVNDFDKGPVEGVSGNGDLNKGCKYTSAFNGTSSAAPVVSGIVALMLEANGDLTWRDVKYILAKTAVQLDADIGDLGIPYPNLRTEKNLANHVYLPDWVTNTAGFKFHNYYGFGGINAEAAVNMAESYSTPLGTFSESAWTESADLTSAIPDNSATGVSNTLSVSTNVTIEGVQIKLNVTHPEVSDVGVELTSPGGTKSVLIPINSQIQGANISDWILSSNAFYGENSQGDWTIKLIDGAASSTGTLTGWDIRFYGY